MTDTWQLRFDVPFGPPTTAAGIAAAWDDLLAACDRLAATERTGRQPARREWDDAERCAMRLGVEMRAQLWARRGDAASPDGHHSPFLGCRCVYCNANSLDVDLYAADTRTCPPVWLCSAGHPDTPEVWCGLPEHHPGDHRDGDAVWPGNAPLPDTGDDTPTSPRRPWWKSSVVAVQTADGLVAHLCDGPPVGRSE